MSIIKFNTLVFSGISCRNYFNDDNDNGIEVSLEGEYVGKMVGKTIVSEDEGDEFTEFVCAVEDWLIENE